MEMPCQDVSLADMKAVLNAIYKCASARLHPRSETSRSPHRCAAPYSSDNVKRQGVLGERPGTKQLLCLCRQSQQTYAAASPATSTMLDLAFRFGMPSLTAHIKRQLLSDLDSWVRQTLVIRSDSFV